MPKKEIDQLRARCKVLLICNTDEVTVMCINLVRSLLDEVERLSRRAGEYECLNQPSPSSKPMPSTVSAG